MGIWRAPFSFFLLSLCPESSDTSLSKAAEILWMTVAHAPFIGICSPNSGYLVLPGILPVADSFVGMGKDVCGDLEKVVGLQRVAAALFSEINAHTTFVLRYKQYCTNIARTLMVDTPPDQEKCYMVLESAHKHMLKVSAGRQGPTCFAHVIAEPHGISARKVVNVVIRGGHCRGQEIC